MFEFLFKSEVAVGLGLVLAGLSDSLAEALIDFVARVC
jgi:hypothetical protein